MNDTLRVFADSLAAIAELTDDPCYLRAKDLLLEPSRALIRAQTALQIRRQSAEIAAAESATGITSDVPALLEAAALEIEKANGP